MQSKPDPLKGVGVISGGLDSSLAAKLMHDLGVEVHLYHFVTGFNANLKGENYAKEIAKQIGAPIEIEEDREPFLEMLKSPRFGRGAAMNPCVDCHLFMFKRAREYMENIGGHFIFTGEVLGQRPMSQHRRALDLIERESGLEKILLRPLSAKMLKPTMMEEKGWIDRQKLLDIKGRSRKIQMKLAKEWGIEDYPSPAGGCLLTDKGFGHRLKDLWESGDDSYSGIQLLKYGRHFRLDPTTKVIVGRNEKENNHIKELRHSDDILLEVEEQPGPLGLFRGNAELIHLAARIVKRYGDGASLPSVLVRVEASESKDCHFLEIEGSIMEEELSKYRIAL